MNDTANIPDKKARENALQLGLLSAAAVAQDSTLMSHIIEDVKEQGVTRRSVYEILLQTYLHDGYATALEATAHLEKHWPADDRGDNENVPFDSSGWNEWVERGEEGFARIYGKMAERVREYIGSNSPELSDWMIAEGYGKVLGRGGVDVQTREMGTVAVLVMKNRPRQLYSHLRGAIRVGVSIDELERLLDLLIAHFRERPGIDESPFLLRTIEQKKDWE